MAINLDPEIAALFRASNSVSGKFKIHICPTGILTLSFKYSFQRHQLSPNEGYSEASQKSKIDPRGQRKEAMGGDRDRQEDSETRRS